MKTIFFLIFALLFVNVVEGQKRGLGIANPIYSPSLTNFTGNGTISYSKGYYKGGIQEGFAPVFLGFFKIPPNSL